MFALPAAQSIPLRDAAKNNVVVLFMLSRPSAAGPWTVTSIYDELRCRDTTALKHLMSGYVASPAVSSVALKLPSIPALCAALTSKVKGLLHGEAQLYLCFEPACIR